MDEKRLKLAYECIGMLECRYREVCDENEALRETIDDGDSTIAGLRATIESMKNERADYSFDCINDGIRLRGMQDRINALFKVLEYRMDAPSTLGLHNHLNPLFTLHDCTTQELAMIHEGKKLAAVKNYRERTGKRLASALKAVRRAGAIHGYYF